MDLALSIAHDLSIVKHISDRIGVMYLGKMVELTESSKLYVEPKHPYTRALLSAVPVPDPDEREDGRKILMGEVGSSIEPPTGCRFHPRCPYATDICRQREPEMQETLPGSGHMTACPIAMTEEGRREEA